MLLDTCLNIEQADQSRPSEEVFLLFMKLTSQHVQYRPGGVLPVIVLSYPGYGVGRAALWAGDHVAAEVTKTFQCLCFAWVVCRGDPNF